MRLIDADALSDDLEQYWKHLNLLKKRMPKKDKAVIMDVQGYIDIMPTVDAVPVEFVIGNYNSEFVCDALTDDGDWCSEHCEFSEAQPECIHRYIERIWSAERRTDETD